MIYTIQQGNHYCDGLNFKLHNNKTQLNFSAMFHENCLYQLPGSENDKVNKLHGLTWGLFNDKNSFRIGWNCKSNNGKIQLFSYIHDRGAVREDYIGEIDILSTIAFNIFFIRSSGYIQINNNVFDNKSVDFNFSGVSKIGYYNYPYFGGSITPAPHDMNIDIW